ncbi:FAD-dependent oxidoreductase [Streptomyces yanii]|uniref:FAD-dependent oxidoreductase n=1 Tax=Streptomyces yanii TaxID=78510 RepID=A0ABV5RPI3_9ACTN
MRLNTPVSAIRLDAQGGLAVLAPAGTLHAEHVILAVPPAMDRIDFGDMLSSDLVRLARATPVWMGADPDVLHVQNWSAEQWTSPSTVQHLADYSLLGHILYQRPALDGRLHWASTETAVDHAGHIEGALAAGKRAAHAVLATPGALNSRSVTTPTTSR